MDRIDTVIATLKAENERLHRELKQVRAVIAALERIHTPRNGTRRLSAAARARIAAGQRRRWAKWRRK